MRRAGGCAGRRKGARWWPRASRWPPRAAPGSAAVAEHGVLPASVEAELVRRLESVPRGSPAWIAASGDDADAIARAEQLRGSLLRAGWDAHPLVRSSHRNRAGYFVLTADDDPPSYALTLVRALEAVGLKVTFWDRVPRLLRRDVSHPSRFRRIRIRAEPDLPAGRGTAAMNARGKRAAVRIGALQ
jgi:hypothetical protein